MNRIAPKVMSLGSGSSGTVFSMRNGTVLKTLPNIPDIDVTKEAILYCKDYNINIAKYIDAIPSKGRIYLKEYQKVNRNIIREHIDLFIRDMLYALAHLEAIGVAHMDIKFSNIMFDGQRFVLIDMGLATLTGSVAYNTEYEVQTVYYRAPELFLTDCFYPSSDMWSLALVIIDAFRYSDLTARLEQIPEVDKEDYILADRLRLVFGSDDINLPYKSKRSLPMRLYNSISTDKFTCPAGTPASVINVLKVCLQIDPTLRASASQLIEVKLPSRKYFFRVEDRRSMLDYLRALIRLYEGRNSHKTLLFCCEIIMQYTTTYGSPEDQLSLTLASLYVASSLTSQIFDFETIIYCAQEYTNKDRLNDYISRVLKCYNIYNFNMYTELLKASDKNGTKLNRKVYERAYNYYTNNLTKRYTITELANFAVTNRELM